MNIDQAVVYQMAIAFGIAVLGTAGIYYTVGPDAEAAPNAVTMITMAAADRAGATVSPTYEPKHMATWAFK